LSFHRIGEPSRPRLQQIFGERAKELERRQFYFDLIGSHLDALYGYVQRELL
jgi:hypothetical protein